MIDSTHGDFILCYDPINPTHYTSGGIETYDYIVAKGLDYTEGNIIKYVSRWRLKGGVEDLRKALWYLERLIEREGGDASEPVRSEEDVTPTPSGVRRGLEEWLRAEEKPPGGETG